mmetsp:Transcript_11572/g.13185  ORF Transcript_11572/g.13185 Transcript_11572/m.13185 type:complete len:194 (+) Transcript_11572:75-656(+)
MRVLYFYISFHFVSSFTIQKNSVAKHHRRHWNHGAISSSSSSNNERGTPTEVDISDLGLTMDDFNAPLPSEIFGNIETTGYESTSKIPDVQDGACMWTESPDKMTATLRIPGLRGQPSMCLSILTATNTLSITAFGSIVWTCVLRGEVKPETVKFETKDGPDMIPTVEFEVDKSEFGERWGGFILQIGENSLL